MEPLGQNRSPPALWSSHLTKQGRVATIVFCGPGQLCSLPLCFHKDKAHPEKALMLAGGGGMGKGMDRAIQKIREASAPAQGHACPAVWCSHLTGCFWRCSGCSGPVAFGKVGASVLLFT